MQVLDVDQIKGWDAYTIKHEPISSLNLMERAALACFRWLMENGFKDSNFHIFCGKGNNGGDGLALARLLTQQGNSAIVHILEFGNKGTDDFQANLNSLHNTSCTIQFISNEESIHPIPKNAIIIDALFGSGLNKPLMGLSAALATHINESGNEVISIDMPSGIYCNQSSLGNIAIAATHTLSFQCYKPAFLVAENHRYSGTIHILDIGLHPDYLDTIDPRFALIDATLLKPYFKKRNRFAHKGNFGYAALVAGSQGMMGAALLSAKACLRTGVGKLTCHIPSGGYTIMQLGVPEAMCKVDDSRDQVTSVKNIGDYNAVGIGPGLGLYETNKEILSECFRNFKKPMVLDADALNTMSSHPELLAQIPVGSVITPHLKEFDRLFGACANDFDRINLAIMKANALQIVIVLKGHHTFIATPTGKHYFNMSGNAGMAKAGNGDILTGMVLAFLAQGYEPSIAARLSVYLHGHAADMAVLNIGMESLMPSDTIAYIGHAIKDVY